MFLLFVCLSGCEYLLFPCVSDTLAGDFLSAQLVYRGKVELCHHFFDFRGKESKLFFADVADPRKIIPMFLRQNCVNLATRKYPIIWYLDDLLNIDNPYFEAMVNQIYPPELQLNKANTSDTKAPFLDLHLSISNGFVSCKIHDKCNDFDFDIVNFPFLDSDVPHSTSYGIYISQLILFARVSSHVADFNAHNKSLTAKLLQQGYRLS